MLKNITEENISQEFRLKNVDETRNYFLEEIKQNELMTKKHRKVCTIINYFEYSLILASTITGCISVSAFVITSCAMTAGIKKYKSIIKKKKKKHDKIVLLAKGFNRFSYSS